MKAPLPRFFVFLAAWAALVATLAVRHTFRSGPPGLVQALVATFTAGFIVATWKVGWLRRAVECIPTRTLVGIHLFRFVGGYFLWLHAQGRLPAEFAQRAGWGDIAAAAGALILIAWPNGTKQRGLLAAWNIFGVIDLAVAVGTAGWLARTRLGSMAEIIDFPLLLVPLFAVPVLATLHVILFRRGLSRTDALSPVSGVSA